MKRFGITLIIAGQTSKTDGSADWSGQVAVDGTITGSLKWTKSDNTVAGFTFAGSFSPSGSAPVTQPAQ